MITICEEANQVLYNVSASGLFNQEIDILSARSSLDLITICSDQYFFSLACLVRGIFPFIIRPQN